MREVCGGVRKETSPSITLEHKGISFNITINEGAELNILSAQHASSANIYVTTTKELISQADGNGMKVVGQTKSPLIIYGIFQGAMIKINLGRVIVFKNLEEDLLLGEPSCKDNKIWTMSHKSSVH